MSERVLGSTRKPDRKKYESLLRAMKETVLNLQRVAEEAELALRRAEERLQEFLDESDDFGR